MQVVVDVAAVGHPLSYVVPEDLSPLVRIGSPVRVPLAGRRVGGWVVAEDGGDAAGRPLRAVTQVTGLGPSAEVVDLVGWAAWRWAGPVAPLLRAASPRRRVHALPVLPGRRLEPEASSRDLRPAGAGPEAGWVVAAVEWPDGSGTDGAGTDGSTPLLAMLPPVSDRFGPLVELVERGHRWRPHGSVLVLVPSPAAAADLTRRLRTGGRPTAWLGEQWAEAAAGWPVVVGSRSAAWAPVPDLALVVVVDAQDQAYREERAPTYDAVAVVIERAARAGVPCVLLSPAPTATQYAVSRRARPPRSVEQRGWPPLQVVDMRNEDPASGILSAAFARLGRQVVDGGLGPGPLLCILQRKGRSRLLACAACGSLARCDRCGRPVHQDDQDLVCACSTTRPALCAACGSTRLRNVRPGVTRVAEQVAALLGHDVIEVVGTDPGPTQPGQLYVGTEALLHRVPAAVAVAFLDLDQNLLAPRFDAGDVSLGLLARAARLVGRRARGGVMGPVLVQTRIPEHPVVQAALRKDPTRYLEGELAVRRELALPPAAAMALVTGPGAAELAGSIPALAGCAVADLGDGRWLVQAADHRTLCDTLAHVRRPRARARVVMDPTDL